MSDLISRAAAIEAVSESLRRVFVEYEDIAKMIIDKVPSAQPERAMKDCRNCKHGNYNDHWGTYFCYHSGDCNDWDKWEPSAQPEPQWIPVSERLPGENEFVLVTFGWFGRKTDPGVNVDEIRGGDWMISEVVTAWMPLPEPYRAERRNDE